MRNNLIRCALREEAEIVAAGCFVIRGEPLHLVGAARPDVDLLIAEQERGSRRLARAGVEHLDLHAEDLAVPLGGSRDVGDIDHEMVERVDFDRHGLPHPTSVALAVLGFVCYNAVAWQFNYNGTGRKKAAVRRETK